MDRNGSDVVNPRPPPSRDALAESRKRNDVPVTWVWRWCSNPKCTDFVWLDPRGLVVRVPGGVTPVVPVCSSSCAMQIITGLSA